MHKHQNSFKESVQKLRAIPAESKKNIIAMAADLPKAEQDIVLERLITLDAELQKNEEQYAASLQRGKAMLQQVQEHDMPSFRLLFHA